MLDRYHSTMATVQNEAPLLAMAMIEHRNLRGAPMSFASMPYLPPLYARVVDSPGIDIISGVQTGKSELFLLLMLYLAGWRGRVCGYILPTFHVRSRFVTRRIDPLLSSVPAYRAKLPGGEITQASKGSQSAKRFGTGTMMFLGSNTPTDFLEFSADALFIDEFDACEPENLSKARDRVLASPYPQIFRLGNPANPGEGIDRLYNNSDRRRWYYRCPRCAECQPLDWFVNFVRRRNDGSWEPRDKERAGSTVVPLGGGLKPVTNDLRPVCRRCDRPFERAESWLAWIAENPGRAAREGYRMTRLDVLSQSMRILFSEWVDAQGKTADLTRFFTSNLGLAYEQAGGHLTVEALQEACRGAENDTTGGEDYAKELVVMGVDVGNVLNVTIDVLRYQTTVQAEQDETDQTVPGMVRVARHVGGYSSFDDLKELIRRFRVQVCCIDSRPETRKCQELRDDMVNECDVWLCQFTAAPRVGRQRFGMLMDYRSKLVSVDRTQLLDASFDDIRFKRRIFPSDAMSVPGWSDQMRAPKRVLEPTKSRIVWTEGSAADHYRLSDAYALCAAELAQAGGTYSA